MCAKAKPEARGWGVCWCSGSTRKHMGLPAHGSLWLPMLSVTRSLWLVHKMPGLADRLVFIPAAPKGYMVKGSVLSSQKSKREEQSAATQTEGLSSVTASIPRRWGTFLPGGDLSIWEGRSLGSAWALQYSTNWTLLWETLQGEMCTGHLLPSL